MVVTDCFVVIVGIVVVLVVVVVVVVVDGGVVVVDVVVGTGVFIVVGTFKSPSQERLTTAFELTANFFGFILSNVNKPLVYKHHY